MDQKENQVSPKFIHSLKQVVDLGWIVDLYALFNEAFDLAIYIVFYVSAL